MTVFDDGDIESDRLLESVFVVWQQCEIDPSGCCLSITVSNQSILFIPPTLLSFCVKRLTCGDAASFSPMPRMPAFLAGAGAVQTLARLLECRL